MLPSFRLSRAANVSNSLLRSCRIRILICAFHSPIERLIHFPGRHAFTTKGMPADNCFCDLFALAARGRCDLRRRELPAGG
jgi:hypothetical protein